jgi:hypothetical protein
VWGIAPHLVLWEPDQPREQRAGRQPGHHGERFEPGGVAAVGRDCVAQEAHRRCVGARNVHAASHELAVAGAVRRVIAPQHLHQRPRPLHAQRVRQRACRRLARCLRFAARRAPELPEQVRARGPRDSRRVCGREALGEPCLPQKRRQHAQPRGVTPRRRLLLLRPCRHRCDLVPRARQGLLRRSQPLL